MRKDLFTKLNIVIHYEQFDEARILISEAIKKLSESSEREDFFTQIELYGYLIDIGCQSRNENDLLSAVAFLELNEEQIKTHITKNSFYYNLANAKHGLGRIFWENNKGVHPINVIKEKFHEPIKLYWLAFKNTPKTNNKLLYEILINLSNSLVDSSRLVESLQFLDMVLKAEPKFPQALISRGDNLQYLGQVTNCAVTISLYAQIYKSYSLGILTGALPYSVLQRSSKHQQEALETIKSHGFSLSQIGKEIHEAEKDLDNHTPFRKFCISNFLTLNEHSIYCNCSAVAKDDLQIGVRHGMFKGHIMPKLELLLNRMKSEFAFARKMYFQSLEPEISVDNDVMFSELLEGEVLNAQSEMQRTSFRICYGILDKIALGICKLYNLEQKPNIYFETFWDNPKRNVELNKIRNIHLNALHSIACDLNTKTGELKQFKDWRNKLEHNLLVIRDAKQYSPDTFNIFADADFVAVADPIDFQQKTLHLLQLTRAAIYSYVFCVRLQTIHHPDESMKDVSVVIDFKK